MMRLIKYLLIIPIVIILLIIGIWFYITYSISSDLNAQYAGKKLSVKNFDKSDYFITLKNIAPTGFPYKISWDINGWQEESRTSQISYLSPIKFGYDLIKQQIFINYDGDIISNYKPISHGFGARLNIEKYQINIDMPLSRKLLEEIKTISNPIQILNHFKNIVISSGRVQIFDLNNNEKFFEKEFEHINISFTPIKQYENLNDLINNIPQQYLVNYSVKTLPSVAKPRILPVSLFYGFYMAPADCDLRIQAEIKTKNSKVIDFMNNYEVRAKISGNSKYFESKNIDFYYQTNKIENYNNIDISSNIKVKPGFFDQLFINYDLYSKSIIDNNFGIIIDGEFRYIIQNKELFKFDQIENTNLDFALKMDFKRDHNKTLLNINDLL